jgi:hypothetical protein
MAMLIPKFPKVLIESFVRSGHYGNLHFVESAKVHQKLQVPKIDNLFLRGQSYISFLMCSCPTGIGEIEYLSIILISLRYMIFTLPPTNIQWMKEEVIPAPRSRQAGRMGTLHPCSANFSRLVIEIKIRQAENYLQ